MTFSALDSPLLGPLVATDAMRGAFSERARLAAMLRVEAALARVEARFGLVADGLAPALEAISPDDLDPGELGRRTALAGVPTIPFVAAVQARLPPEVGAGFHKGATTQDVLDSALVLQMRDGFALLAADLDATLAGLLALAERHAGTACVGRTYRQQAQPTSFGFKAATWCAGLAEAAAELPAVRARALRVSLGGPVGTLAGLGPHGPAVADGVAAELGLRPAPISWHVRRGGVAATGAWLAGLIGGLAKMAADVVDLASTEVGEVAEPHLPGRGGSSAMPHKRNPVSATVILAAHGAAPALASILLGAMAAEHERPAGLWHAEWHALPSLFGLASGALAEGRQLAEGLVVDPARMRADLGATRGLLFADAVAARLAPALGRAAAHARLEAAATRVRETGEPLDAVLRREPDIVAALGEDGLAAAFDPGPAVAAAGAWVARVAPLVAAARAALATEPETSR